MAYVIEAKATGVRLPYLPQRGHLKSGIPVEFDHFRESDVDQLYSIFNSIVEEGLTYPQESVGNIQDFRSYYLSHDVFVLREVPSGQVLGSFYVKPNYPGRSAHICNAGFLVAKGWQGQGIGNYLVPQFLSVAPDLGYLASVFNLVYTTNLPSIHLWRKFGFKEIGRVPNAGNLKGVGYTDAIQFYYDFKQYPAMGDTQLKTNKI